MFIYGSLHNPAIIFPALSGVSLFPIPYHEPSFLLGAWFLAWCWLPVAGCRVVRLSSVRCRLGFGFSHLAGSAGPPRPPPSRLQERVGPVYVEYLDVRYLSYHHQPEGEAVTIHIFWPFGRHVFKYKLPLRDYPFESVLANFRQIPGSLPTNTRLPT